jgi:hypothetical protein
VKYFFSRDVLNLSHNLIVSCSKFDGRFIGKAAIDLSKLRDKETITAQVPLIGANQVFIANDEQKMFSLKRSDSENFLEQIKQTFKINEAASLDLKARHSHRTGSVSGVLSSEPPVISLKLTLFDTKSRFSSLRKEQVMRIMDRNARLKIFPLNSNLNFNHCTSAFEDTRDPIKYVLILGKENPLDGICLMLFSLLNFCRH